MKEYIGHQGILVMTAALIVAAAGCRTGTSAAGATPEAALKAYAAALRAGDVDRAYALMSRGYQKRFGEKDFKRILKENQEEVTRTAEHLDRRAERVKVEANLRYDQDGQGLKLVLEKGQWKIASNPLDFYGQRTPAQALRSFIRAIEKRRYDIVLRFVPAKWAESMTVEKLRKQWEGDQREEVATLIKNLKANLDATIHVSGDTATMAYGEHFEVRFVRENGRWMIADPD